MGSDLTVSIVTFGLDRTLFPRVLQHLAVALQHARDAGLALQSRVDLIDNGQDAAELRALLTTHLGNQAWTLSHGAGNVGFGRAHNRSLLQADSRYHLVMNPDVLLDPSALTEGLAHLQAHPEILALGPLALDESGAPCHLCKRYPSVADLALRGFAPDWLQRRFADRLARYECRDLPGDRPSQGIELLSGCCLLVRTAPLQRLGGFDEGYFLYFEDFDLSLRLRALGELAYLPAMRIAHFGGDASRKGLRHICLFARSAFRFFRQHGWR